MTPALEEGPSAEREAEESRDEIAEGEERSPQESVRATESSPDLKKTGAADIRGPTALGECHDQDEMREIRSPR